MPQMSPMNWIILSMWFLIMIYMVKSSINMIIKESNSKNKKSNNMKLFKSKNMW